MKSNSNKYVFNQWGNVDEERDVSREEMKGEDKLIGRANQYDGGE